METKRKKKTSTTRYTKQQRFQQTFWILARYWTIIIIIMMLYDQTNIISHQCWMIIITSFTVVVVVGWIHKLRIVTSTLAAHSNTRIFIIVVVVVVAVIVIFWTYSVSCHRHYIQNTTWEMNQNPLDWIWFWSFMDWMIWFVDSLMWSLITGWQRTLFILLKLWLYYLLLGTATTSANQRKNDKHYENHL